MKNSEIAEGEIYEAEILRIGYDGRGVCRIKNIPVFIPGTAEGDKIKARITKVHKSFCEGEAAEIEVFSKHRQENDCPYFCECGGCVLRHISYEYELLSKEENVFETLRRVGGIEGFEKKETEGCFNTLRYRNKAVYKVQNGEWGFFAPESHRLVKIKDCLLCGETDKDINEKVIEWTKNTKSIFIRRSSSGGGVMVAVDAEVKNAAKLTEAVKGADSDIVSILAGGRLIYGNDCIEDEILGIRFKISEQSFFQINPEMTKKLYSYALSQAQIKKTDRVLDIYCGIGTISLCAARSAKSVTGVEITEKAVSDAWENAKLNGIDNAVFCAGKAENIVPDLIKRGERADIVILDPPRKGSDKNTLNAITEAAPERIVYISCNPSTLARDLKYLEENGYKTVSVKVFDMFPKTAHVETIVLLQRETL